MSKMARKLYERLFVRGREHGEGQLDPALSERDAAAILGRVGANFLRGCWWRLRLGSCGGRLFVARGARLMNPRHIHCGRDVKFEELCEIHGLSRQGVHFGDGVTVGRCASIRPSSYYGGELGEGIRVGDHSSIGAFCWFGASGPVEIGSNVLFGPRVVLIPENHRFSATSTPIRHQGVERKAVVVEDDCWIGTNVTILAGVRIGHGSIVAAGSVVNKDVEPWSIVGGVPARLLRKREGAP